MTRQSYGKVTFEVSSPVVAGVVTAVILIGKHAHSISGHKPQPSHPFIADEHDEIDIEMLGGDPSHWQTNVFVPAPKDKEPLYGVFGSIEDVPGAKPSIQDFHQYTIDWDAKKIEWSVDGKTVRTLKKGMATFVT